jgi:hypothetical protein
MKMGIDSNEDHRMWQEAKYMQENNLIQVNKTHYEQLKQKVELYEAAEKARIVDDIYKTEGMAIFIKGKLAFGIHPNNLTNNLYHLSKGNMNIDWATTAKNHGIDLGKLPENVFSGVIDLRNNND